MPTPEFPVNYQKLFHALSDNFLLIAPNADATILDNTNSHERVSMKSREEAVGKPFFEAYPASDEESARIIRESHEHVRLYREPHTMPLIRYDLERPSEQGGGLEERYWEATHYPVLDEQGQLEFILQRTQDVTERYRAELLSEQTRLELARQQERTNFILESLPVMIWTASPDGQRDFFNSRWLQFTGSTLGQQTGEQWLQQIHPDDQQRILGLWHESVRTGNPYQAEYRLRRHDGQYRWILMRGQPHRNSQGHITMWVGGGTDIQDQKQMVQELLEQNEQQAILSDQAYQAFQQVQKQRETFYNLFIQTPALICILRGPEHRFEFVNPPYQQLFPNRELVGKTVQEALPEVIEQGFIELLDGVYNTGQTFEGKEVEIMLDQDGSGNLQRHYLNFTYQLFQENGHKAGITVFAFDVTDLVLSRQAIEKLNSDAR
ncbi:hypothetical protein GCM10027346_31220 [Hymenobacter seoulensis]